MKIGSRWKAVTSLLRGFTLSEDEIMKNSSQAMKSLEDVNEELINIWMAKLLDEFPEIGPSLVHERDMYLAWSLKRSKAVNGCAKVVGVVGRAHLRGVMYALSSDPGQLLFKDLVGDRNNRKNMTRSEATIKILQRLAFELAIGYACYIAWVRWTN